jgi:hypothetical protein
MADVIVWHHGGAMSRVDESETAYGGRDTAFFVTGEASWDRSVPHGRRDRLGPRPLGPMERHSTGAFYLNFAGLGEEAEALVRGGYGDNYERLTELKRTYDPENLFRMNLNITPASCARV